MKLGIRIWVLIFALLLSLLAIAPWKTFDDGVMVKTVEANSTAFNQGMRQGQTIEKIDGVDIESLEDYSNVMNAKNFSNSTHVKTVVLTDQGEFILFGSTPEMTVSELPSSNLKTGLDLSGGARAIVKAKDKDLSSQEINDLISVINNRLNVYGLADVKTSSVTDLEGNNFMMVEVAGATPADLTDLISQQGKFEAKIGNDTAFIGGERDITSVSRSGQEAFIEQCQQITDGYSCNFRFTIYLSEDAARRHAELTKNLAVNSTAQGRYLSEPLNLYLDDTLVDSLLIDQDLRGRLTTQVSISGPGVGATQEEAFTSAEENMNKLQTLLITGSLPYQLEIVKMDTISPTLGREFTRNIILLGLSVFVIISVILFIKYRKIKSTLAVIMTMFSEAFITLGIAALISWNLDAPSIAGIIAGMGTGVNDQIIILDESVSNRHIDVRERIKRALFVIFGAFFTIIAAMLPLFWAGAGMLKGFALTTILSVTVGILITRPAFANIIRRLEE